MELKTGSAESTLDDKGRVSVPLRFREQYQGELIITRGMERCVWVMTPSAWGHFKKNLYGSGEFTQAERRLFEDTLINLGDDVELDKAGRIAVPPVLRKYANLTKDCIVISAGDRLSIWDSEEFDTYLRKKEEQAQAAMDKLGAKDIFRDS
ncbi:MAG: division/cell wall cluster transcriptional repressor MraZ [Treponema sp.]|nr:division/cell wall cluster transcriptional repressor MraZ [Treponema sp.]